MSELLRKIEQFESQDLAQAYMPPGLLKVKCKEAYGEAALLEPKLIVNMADGTIIDATYHADDLFGYIRGELVAIVKNFHYLIPERFRDKHMAEHWPWFLKDPKPMQMGKRDAELYGLRKDGTEFPVEVGLQPQMVGPFRAVIVSVTDMSKRVEMEHQHAEGK